MNYAVLLLSKSFSALTIVSLVKTVEELVLIEVGLQLRQSFLIELRNYCVEELVLIEVGLQQ